MCELRSHYLKHSFLARGDQMSKMRREAPAFMLLVDKLRLNFPEEWGGAVE